MKTTWTTATMTMAVMLAALPVSAQISVGGRPKSLTQTVKASIQTVTTASVDHRALLAEDVIEQAKDMPYRFGQPFDVNYDLNNSGTWENLSDGSRLWRLRIESARAYSINLIYDDFWLPDGAQFFIYNADRSMTIGAFTSKNNKEYGQFATALVRGDVSILEYWEPADVSEPGRISISRIVHAYRNLFSWATAKEALKYGGDDPEAAGFGDAGSCNNNARCPEFAEWDDIIRSAAMITTSGGFRLCSGSMLNNVRKDKTPYFLTANHCLGGEQTWVFMFNYESAGCANVDGPTWMTVSGSTLRATRSFSDFALLELSAQPPDSYNVAYAGWNAIDVASDSVIGIHHPQGDIKKISFDFDAVTATSYLGTSVPGDNSHWRIGQWEDGTTEPGSSGSPIFNRQRQVIGQLHGGWASCTSITSDYYGKVSISWAAGSSASTRLKDWLDPDNTGVLQLNGLGAGVAITHTPLMDTQDTLNDYEVLA
ncbi:MAG: trypsin-like serine peptidase, partial [Candidatus Zixiibacteriota bacterium]